MITIKTPSNTGFAKAFNLSEKDYALVIMFVDELFFNINNNSDINPESIFNKINNKFKDHQSRYAAYYFTGIAFEVLINHILTLPYTKISDESTLN